MSANQKNKAEPTKSNAVQADCKIELNLSRRKKRRKTGW